MGTTPASQERAQSADGDGEQVFAERGRIEKVGRIRQLVFGSMDGLLVPLGVVSGVAAGSGTTKAVIVAGLAEAFAGALSMGAGEFISGRSEAQVQAHEVRKELAEMESEPELELQEMALLLQHEGVSEADAQLIATTLAQYPRAYAKTMVEKELGIPFDPGTVKVPEALTMGASYMVAALIPLVSYFFLPLRSAFVASLGLTFLALVLLGYVKGRLAELNLARSVGEVLAVGLVSGLGGYLLGDYLPRLFGY
jgi:VIT1/CCC1 family predicted Fe2+/Mn2+ transporter